MKGTLTLLLMLAGLAGLARWAEGTAAPVQIEGTRQQWAYDLLTQIGNPRPTQDTIDFVVEWTIAEDGSGGAFARNNPLNTTICGHNWVGAINGDGACGVGGYATYQDGLDATVDTLAQGNFSAIAYALQSNDAEGAKQALFASPWAASHYNYGVGWPQLEETQEGGTQPRVSSTHVNLATACPLASCTQSGTGYGPSHPGIDLGATLGEPVYATMSGVARTSQTWPCGNGVQIDNEGVEVLMCHLSGFSVQEGAFVQAGQQVGLAGSSGDSTGPHVHYEIRVNGQNIDPTGVLTQ